MKKTTIQINVNTLERLKALKSVEKQSYDDVLNLLIDDSEEEILSEKEIKEIQKGLEDIKAGRLYSKEQVAKELGISLK